MSGRFRLILQTQIFGQLNCPVETGTNEILKDPSHENALVDGGFPISSVYASAKSILQHAFLR